MAVVTTHSKDDGAESQPDSAPNLKPKVYLLDSATQSERLRLHYQHEALKMLQDGKLLLSHLSREPTFVLDVATGTANWAYEFAEQHPESTVVGVDTTEALDPSPPPNFQFHILDIQDHWSFPQPFDVIHCRLLFTLQIDFRRLIAQAYANLSPGGCLEFQEYLPIPHHDGHLDTNSASYRWMNAFQDGLAALGQDWMKASEVDSFMKQHGFVDVQVRSFRVAYGDWPSDSKEKKVGLLYEREVNARYIPLWRAIIGRGLGWSNDAIDELWQEKLREAESGSARLWHEYRVIFGKRPG